MARYRYFHLTPFAPSSASEVGTGSCTRRTAEGATSLELGPAWVCILRLAFFEARLGGDNGLEKNRVPRGGRLRFCLCGAGP